MLALESFKSEQAERGIKLQRETELAVAELSARFSQEAKATDRRVEACSVLDRYRSRCGGVTI